MENLSFELNEILDEVMQRMKDEGEISQGQFNDIVDEVLEERRDLGILPDDFDFKGTADTLKLRWNQAREELFDPDL